MSKVFAMLYDGILTVFNDSGTNQSMFVPRSINSVVFSSNQDYLGYTSKSSVQKIYRRTQNVFSECNQINSPCVSMDFSRDGKFIATVSDNSVIHIWPIDMPKVITNFMCDFGIKKVFFLARYNCLIALNDRVYLWNIGLPTPYREKMIDYIGLTMSPDRAFFATTHRNGTVTIWDTFSMQKVNTITRWIHLDFDMDNICTYENPKIRLIKFVLGYRPWKIPNFHPRFLVKINMKFG